MNYKVIGDVTFDIFVVFDEAPEYPEWGINMHKVKRGKRIVQSITNYNNQDFTFYTKYLNKLYASAYLYNEVWLWYRDNTNISWQVISHSTDQSWEYIRDNLEILIMSFIL